MSIIFIMITLIDMFKNYRMPILALVLLLLLTAVIVFLKKSIRRKQKNKELEQAAADKLRDENLNNVILNSHAQSGILKEVYKPYDVDYSSPNSENGRKKRKRKEQAGYHVMVQLVEKTELSTRKFMMNPAKKIRIGSSLQDNDITILADGISPYQCEIFSIRSKVYIKNISSENRTIIKRKKEKAIVDDKGIRLLTNDTVILGSVLYEITIVD